jgi:hypothetical protein
VSREVQWLVNRQGKAKLEDEFQVFLKKSGGAGKEGYLLVGVNGHHPVKSTLQVGLEALRLAHHGFHGGKLFFVAGQDAGHSGVQGRHFFVVGRNFGGQVGTLGGQR